MKIGGLQKLTLIDFPHHLSCCVFVFGCNFRCPFCDNAQLVLPGKIKSQVKIPEKDFFDFLKERRGVLEGVVVSGGEPTLQPDLPAFLKRIQKLGFDTMIESNGSRPKVIAKLLAKKLVNFFAIDFKAPLAEKYAKTVGLKKFDPEIWVKSFRLVLRSGVPFELRTTVVPGIHNEKILVKMAKELKKLATRNSKLVNWRLQNFQPKNCLDPELEKIIPFSKIEMEEFLKIAKNFIPSVALRY